MSTSDKVESTPLQLLDGAIASHRAGELEEWELQLVRRRIVEEAALSADLTRKQPKIIDDGPSNRALQASERAHVAWCRYIHRGDGAPTIIELCDSDDEGAFKVYR
jgi:hypothetical protein